MPDQSAFDEIGGEPALRAIIDRFIDRVCDDVMIGFLFRNIDRAQLKQREYEFAARFLGAPVAYTGRPLDRAHESHRIMGGQFMRRKQILRETLAEFRVPEHVQESWLEHTQRLMSMITRDRPDECAPRAARGANPSEPGRS